MNLRYQETFCIIFLLCTSITLAEDFDFVPEQNDDVEVSCLWFLFLVTNSLRQGSKAAKEHNSTLPKKVLQHIRRSFDGSRNQFTACSDTSVWACLAFKHTFLRLQWGLFCLEEWTSGKSFATFQSILFAAFSGSRLQSVYSTGSAISLPWLPYFFLFCRNDKVFLHQSLPSSTNFHSLSSELLLAFALPHC